MTQPKIRTVSTILVKTEQLQLQCSVPLFDMTTDELSPINIFKQSAKNMYMTSNPQTVLRLRYIASGPKKVYDKSAICNITPKNIHGLRIVLKTFYERYERDDMYSYDEHGQPVSINAIKGDVINYPMDDTHVIQLQPIMYHAPTKELNEAPVTIPGIGLIINFKQNLAILSVEEFLWLQSVIDRFDFAQYGHMLLMEYLMFAKQIPTQIKSSSAINDQDDAWMRSFKQPSSSDTVSQKPIINRNPTLENL